MNKRKRHTDNERGGGGALMVWLGIFEELEVGSVALETRLTKYKKEK